MKSSVWLNTESIGNGIESKKTLKIIEIAWTSIRNELRKRQKENFFFIFIKISRAYAICLPRFVWYSLWGIQYVYEIQNNLCCSLVDNKFFEERLFSKLHTECTENKSSWIEWFSAYEGCVMGGCSLYFCTLYFFFTCLFFSYFVFYNFQAPIKCEKFSIFEECQTNVVYLHYDRELRRLRFGNPL